MIIDLTQQFHSLIPNPQPHSHSILPSPSPTQTSIQAQLCLKQSSDILVNLQKISQILNQNRQNYFSNAAYSYEAFTDQQRHQFDKEMKILLDSVNVKIGELKDVVDRIRFRTTTEKEHLKNMALCLYGRFKKVSGVFRGFVEFSQNRKKKLQSMIGNQIKKQYKQAYRKSQQPPPQPHSQSTLPRTNSQSTLPRTNSLSSPDPQLQSQSKQIFQSHISEQKKLQQTRKTIEQINSMLQVMENKILEQELLTSSFREIGEIGLFHIQKGNKNLVDANSIAKDSGRLWTMFFLGLGLSLLVLDYLKS